MVCAIKRFIVGLVAMFTVLPLTALGAAADGMSHVYVPTYDTWELAIEDSQFAMISLVDGKENLIIQASVSSHSLLAGAQAVWFFPIPSRPDDANITIVQTISSLDGYFLSSLARREVDEKFAWVYGSQLYPLLALGMTLGTQTGEYGGRPILSKEIEGTSEGFTGVVISEHVEAFGLSSELISASNSSAIDGYLVEKGLELPQLALELLDGYVGQEYSFVISWISDIDEFKSQSQLQLGYSGYVYRLGVSVTFPATRMYYPLKLTSIYDDQEIPMIIQVLGRANPIRFEDNDEQKLVDAYQCLDPSYYVNEQNAWFFKNELRARNLDMGGISDVEFTIITMTGPSNYLTEDLWIEPEWGLSAAATNLVYHNSWIVILAALVVASVLASVTAGWIVYRPFGPDLMMFAALGFMNLLTFAGMIAAVYVFDIEKNFMNPDTERMVWHRRKDFLFAFTIIFLGFAFALHGIALYALS
ncbi:MAG: hypothetical protein A3K60_00535 [Euryarchaeota archaeon RBG_19FT_COMBO_56_21]|nr:MAG: hypothetical protein A3K60_00535 [Euryarchaeota archaeon RBG_19FT_COMBO_56_21]